MTVAPSTPYGFQLQRGRDVGVEITGDSLARLRFKQWNAPGTLIDGSDHAIESFTHVNASQFVSPMNHSNTSLIIERNPSYNIVEWEGLGPLAAFVWETENTDVRIVLHGPMDAEVRLSHEPGPMAPPGWTSFGWTAYCDNFESVTTLGARTTVRLGSSVRVTPNLSPISCLYGTWTHSGVARGGGKVYAGIGDDCAPFAGAASCCALPENYSGPTANVRMHAIPNPGFQFSHFIKQGGTSDIFSSIKMPYSFHRTNCRATAYFVRQPELEFIVRVEDADDSPMCAGYCIASPAKKYYTALTTPPAPWLGRSPEIVRAQAVPRYGYRFVRWEGHGVAWLNAQGTEGEWTQVTGPAYRLDDPNNRLTNPTIFIKMCDELESRPLSRTLIAIFAPSCLHCGRPTGPRLNVNYGRLVNDTFLPDGAGYYRTAGNNFYGCPHYIHKIIRNVGRRWAALYPDGPRIGITRISNPGGGYTQFGKSHQNGLDVDVRYVRNSGEGPYTFPNEPPYVDYNQTATQQLIDLFSEYDIALIWAYSGASLQGVTNRPDHKDHIHIRFVDPDGLPPTHCQRGCPADVECTN